MVVAQSFLREHYPDRDRRTKFRDYQAAGGGLTIFTCGDAPVWYAKPNGAIRYSAPYSIDLLDTSGAGDSFRAGIVFGFLKGWTDEEMIDFAAPLAAIICTGFPGVLNAPTSGEVADFMRVAKRNIPPSPTGSALP